MTEKHRYHTGKMNCIELLPVPACAVYSKDTQRQSLVYVLEYSGQKGQFHFPATFSYLINWRRHQFSMGEHSLQCTH
jgi:hypothetical protein